MAQVCNLGYTGPRIDRGVLEEITEIGEGGQVAGRAAVDAGRTSDCVGEVGGGRRNHITTCLRRSVLAVNLAAEYVAFACGLDDRAVARGLRESRPA